MGGPTIGSAVQWVWVPEALKSDRSKKQSRCTNGLPLGDAGDFAKNIPTAGLTDFLDHRPNDLKAGIQDTVLLRALRETRCPISGFDFPSGRGDRCLHPAFLKRVATAIQYHRIEGDTLSDFRFFRCECQADSLVA